MKRLATTFFALAVLVALALPANAAVLLNETFTYPDGALVGNGGWTAHSGAGAKVIMVAGGAVTLQQSTGSGEDVNAPFTQQGAAAITYYSLDVTVNGTVGTGSEYFSHFRVPATNFFSARVFVGPPLASGNFTFGLRAGSASTTVFWPSDFTYGVKYKVVAFFDASTGNAGLWIDPATQASPSISSTGGVIGDQVGEIALRQAAPTGATLTEVIDNILVGQAFSDVAGGATAVEATSWGRVKMLYP
jgi:hypothetical protein